MSCKYNLTLDTSESKGTHNANIHTLILNVQNGEKQQLYTTKQRTGAVNLSQVQVPALLPVDLTGPHPLTDTDYYNSLFCRAATYKSNR